MLVALLFVEMFQFGDTTRSEVIVLMFWSTQIPKSAVPMVNLDSEESLGLRRVTRTPKS